MPVRGGAVTSRSHAALHMLGKISYCNITSPELAMPVRGGAVTSRSHAALHMLGKISYCNITSSELVMQVRGGAVTSRSHAALHMLGKTSYCNISIITYDSSHTGTFQLFCKMIIRHDMVVCLCLGCLDTLSTASQLGLNVYGEQKEKLTTAKVYAREDYAVVNRFESKPM